MKIRNGFVSNSSTSSFLIYGVKLDVSRRDFNVGTEEEDYSVYEFLDSKIDPNSNLSCWRPYDEFFIGASWARVKDDETGAQFKERVEKAIKEYLKEVGYTKPLVFGTHSEAWHD